MKLFDIFKRKPKKVRFRDQESVFFTMTDENGISYANMSDTIEYIPVGTTLVRGIMDGVRFRNRKYDNAVAGIFNTACLFDIESWHPSSIVYDDGIFPGYHFERSSNE